MAQWLHRKGKDSVLLQTQEEVEQALADGYGYAWNFDPKDYTLNYDVMSDEELRELAKEKKIRGAHNAKRETLIKKLSE